MGQIYGHAAGKSGGGHYLMLWDREMRKKDDLRVVFFDERAWRAGVCAYTHYIRAQRGNEDSGLRAADALSDYFLIETRVGHRVSRGDFGLCGVRLRALP